MPEMTNPKLAEGERFISVGQAIKLVQEDKFRAAAHMCAEILEQMPENATAICLKAFCEWRMQKPVGPCVAEVRRALAMAPESALVRLYLATILISTGENEEAKQLLLEALDVEPKNTNALFDYVEIEKFKQETALIQRFDAQYQAGEFSGQSKEIAGYALAKVYDDLKQPEKAIQYADEANALTAREYDRAYYDARIADLEKLANRKFSKIPTSKFKNNQPIFIVGMPRSGTTLVETILSRHPDVFAAGEMNLMPRIEGRGYHWAVALGDKQVGPHTMLRHTSQDILTQNVLQIQKFMAPQLGEGKTRYTDKLPMNAFRLPLISRLYPEAPIIFMRRHPLDVALSNYFKRFSRGMEFSFSQKHIGHYFQNMMAHMQLSRKLIPNPVLDVSYELLVEDFETHVRRLVQFVGLSWHDACLNPEQSDRQTVMTASKWQVRQPIYSSSKAKWTRYEPYIADLISSFGGADAVEQFYQDGRTAGAA